MKNIFKKNLLTGLLVTLPLALTCNVLASVVNGVDGMVSQILQQVGGSFLKKFYFPGLGFLVIFLFIFFVGLIGSNLIGNRIISFGDYLLRKIPFVRSIYVNSKKVVEVISQSDEKLFKKLVLVDFPGDGTKAIGLICCNTQGEIAHVAGKNLVNVYIFSTPNFTSGYLLIVPRENLVDLDCSVEEGLATVISLGAIVPQQRKTVRY